MDGSEKFDVLAAFSTGDSDSAGPPNVAGVVIQNKDPRVPSFGDRIIVEKNTSGRLPIDTCDSLCEWKFDFFEKLIKIFRFFYEWVQCMYCFKRYFIYSYLFVNIKEALLLLILKMKHWWCVIFN